MKRHNTAFKMMFNLQIEQLKLYFDETRNNMVRLSGSEGRRQKV